MALTYDELPSDILGLIKEFVAFTNESLQRAINLYFRDRALCERRHCPIGLWDVSRVTNMDCLFNRGITRARYNFDEDLGAWDVSSVTKMGHMFSCIHGYSGKGIGAWDVSSVTSMDSMFKHCARFQGDIGGWDVSSVKTMYGMFHGCRVFNRDISAWDVSSVWSFGYMFCGCYMFDQNIGCWDVSGADKMQKMFSDARSFNQDLRRWRVSDKVHHARMFYMTPVNGYYYNRVPNSPNILLRYSARHTAKLRLPETLLNWDEVRLEEREEEEDY